jgi:hypothetical protein
MTRVGEFLAGARLRIATVVRRRGGVAVDGRDEARFDEAARSAFQTGDPAVHPSVGPTRASDDSGTAIRGPVAMTDLATSPVTRGTRATTSGNRAGPPVAAEDNAGSSPTETDGTGRQLNDVEPANAADATALTPDGDGGSAGRSPRRARQTVDTAPESLLRTPTTVTTVADEFFTRLKRRVDDDR